MLPLVPSAAAQLLDRAIMCFFRLVIILCVISYTL